MALVVPEVSLISSWYVPPATLATKKAEQAVNRKLPSLLYALKQGVNVHDLKFLGHSDVSWYVQAAERNDLDSERDPLEFVSQLELEDLDRIADRLTVELTDNYEGPLVGPRPRFSALATYWHLISLPIDEDGNSLRKKSVIAIQNSLYLAARLGCRYVEVVGGAAIPTGTVARQKKRNAQDYRESRLKTLSNSIVNVYTDNFGTDLQNRLGEALPVISIEIEPGESFLINRVEAYCDLKSELPRQSVPNRQTMLNIDIAHMMLLNHGTTDVFNQIAQKELHHEIAHMHVSDHSRTHAADLCPGTYHFFTDYKKWLNLAVELSNQQDSRFSRVVAVEMESVNDVHEAVRSVGKVRRWIQEVMREKSIVTPTDAKTDVSLSEGALLVVDIGNSTAALIDHELPAKGAQQLEQAISEVCKRIHKKRGSVLSFTGDGVIAFFDKRHFEHEGSTANSALEAAMALEKAIKEIPVSGIAITLRAALHYGEVYVPAGGRLRHQAIGRDVVRATRVCSWIAEDIERAIPPISKDRAIIIAATIDFWKRLPENEEKKKLRYWGNRALKGMRSETTIYLDEDFHVPHKSSPSANVANDG